MHARSTTVRGEPSAVDAGIARVRDHAWPELQRMEGCIGLSMLADRGSGRCIVTTAWDSEEMMRRHGESAGRLRTDAARVLGGEPEVAEWEIARVHRVRPTGDGACVRVVWGQARPEQLDRDLDVYTYSMVPELEDVPGFCSVSQLVDRYTGRSATAVSYVSRTAMDRADRQMGAMREEYAQMTGVRVLEVAEFDLVVAHLRVPEMA
jgi:heme-degrading monooxygenase HmoA